jgi:glycosyltransferase involved in cell wall biosynthesis
MNNASPVKLAIIYTDLGLGGIQRKIVDLVNFLHTFDQRQRFSADVILKWKTDFSLESDFNSPNVRVFYPARIFPFPRRRMPFWFNILHRFLSNPPDIILTHVFGSSLRSIVIARLFLRNKVKIIISQDNIFSFENTEWYSKLLAPIVYPLANIIIVQTERSKADLVDNWNISSDKIAVIPNWARKITIRKRKRDIDILYCGRFEDQKNLIRLLKICRKLEKRKKGLKVLLVGSGRQESYLKRYVNNNNLGHTILFEKPTNAVNDYYFRSKIFGLTSKFEGQPMALLEAMSCGCAPVLTNFPGSSEYITHKYNGMIAQTDNEFIEYALACISDEKQRSKISLQAQQTVQEYYSEANIQKYIDLLMKA